MDNKISWSAAPSTKRAEYLLLYGLKGGEKQLPIEAPSNRRAQLERGELFVSAVHTAHGDSSYRKGRGTINATFDNTEDWTATASPQVADFHVC